jgi:hypothetical protein
MSLRFSRLQEINTKNENVTAKKTQVWVGSWLKSETERRTIKAGPRELEK